ncbi:hypothetical protein NLI96_g3447 [Meripilus lineatus]|uniref:Impact N-terminal domain-containing protein n=1 Tax=Meripilus lineatus TaxID=2056292 RepID=A0AAD5YGK0_9APHY|nr:hypothetical protein NLI96_g3447 [Physisporinus lineatus]
MDTLDSFITSSRPPPEPVAISKELKDRGSTFLGHIYKISSSSEATRTHSYLKNVVHSKQKADHEIYAWRCMVLKDGKTGLNGPEDFEVKSGCKDDGERFAGARVLKVMESEGVMDAVVIVTRWFGGELLGPIRFDHIDACARQVCRTFLLYEQTEDHITTLSSLDDILSTLRSELAELKKNQKPNPTDETETKTDGGAYSLDGVPGRGHEGLTKTLSKEDRDKPFADADKAETVPSSTPSRSAKRPDYKSLRESQDVSKLKRLITARENSIKSVKAAIKGLQTTDG